MLYINLSFFGVKLLERSEKVICPKCAAGTGFYLYKTEMGNFYLRCQACRHEIPVDVKLLGL